MVNKKIVIWGVGTLLLLGGALWFASLIDWDAKWGVSEERTTDPNEYVELVAQRTYGGVNERIIAVIRNTADVPVFYLPDSVALQQAQSAVVWEAASDEDVVVRGGIEKPATSEVELLPSTGLRYADWTVGAETEKGVYRFVASYYYADNPDVIYEAYSQSVRLEEDEMFRRSSTVRPIEHQRDEESINVNLNEAHGFYGENFIFGIDGYGAIWFEYPEPIVSSRFANSAPRIYGTAIGVSGNEREYHLQIGDCSSPDNLGATVLTPLPPRPPYGGCSISIRTDSLGITKTNFPDEAMTDLEEPIHYGDPDRERRARVNRDEGSPDDGDGVYLLGDNQFVVVQVVDLDDSGLAVKQYMNERDSIYKSDTEKRWEAVMQISTNFGSYAGTFHIYGDSSEIGPIDFGGQQITIMPQLGSVFEKIHQPNDPRKRVTRYLFDVRDIALRLRNDGDVQPTILYLQPGPRQAVYEQESE